jgi:hypothetical protein
MPSTKESKQRTKLQQKERARTLQAFDINGVPHFITNDDLPKNFGRALGDKALRIINVLMVPMSYYLTDKDIGILTKASTVWVFKFRHSSRCKHVLNVFEGLRLRLARPDLVTVALVRALEGSSRFWDRAAEMAKLWAPHLKIEHDIHMPDDEREAKYNAAISLMTRSLQHLTGAEPPPGILQDASTGDVSGEIPAEPDGRRQLLPVLVRPACEPEAIEPQEHTKTPSDILAQLKARA